MVCLNAPRTLFSKLKCKSKFVFKKNEKGYVRNEVNSVAIANVQMLLIDLSVSAKIIPECV